MVPCNIYDEVFFFEENAFDNKQKKKGGDGLIPKNYPLVNAYKVMLRSLWKKLRNVRN